ncbi:MAG: GNAT family protein [Chloroflexota bacterium]
MSHFDFSEFPTLETERLRLRRITTDDKSTWLAIFQNDEVRRYLIDFEDNSAFDDISEIVDWTDEIYKDKSGIRWAITLTPDDTMIGSCGFHVYSEHHRSAEIGYELSHEHWRKGIMSEAVGAVLDFCFEQLAVHRIEADVTVGNEASAGLLKSLGFTHEGTWRDKVYVRGQFFSLWQFGLLAGEYQK